MGNIDAKKNLKVDENYIHVYLMPGLAANPSIFENIKLPKDTFKIHWLEWEIPNNDDSLEDYAKRMCNYIEYKGSVLLGVSFGGMLVQEMCKHIDLRKLFVISSIKSHHELPKRLKILRKTKAYKILPTRLVSHVDVLEKYSFGSFFKKRLSLYKKYLSVRDPKYLDWAIKQVVTWNQEEPNPDAIYIHGDKDIIFPHSCQGNCIVIKGGTHIMIINKFKWFNENLPKLILD